MAELDKINSFITRLLQQLSEVYKECDKRTVCTETVCSDCSRLFKPWPKKQLQVKTKDPGQTRKEAEKNAGGDTVPVEELAELHILDQVLSKARKVRTKYQDKLKEMHDAETPEGATNIDIQGHMTGESSYQDKPIESVQTTEPSKINKRKLTSKDQLVQSDPPRRRVTAYSIGVSGRSKNTLSQKSDTIGIVSQSKLNRLLQKPSLGSAPSKPSHAPSNKRFTPAHASAPFRTDPIHQRRSKVMRSGVRSHVDETSCDDVAQSCVLVMDKDVGGSVTDDTSVSQRQRQTEEWLQQSVVTTATVSAGVDCLGKCVDRGGCLTDVPQAGGDTADGREKLFHLQTDGHSVQLPRSLVRVASINRKLRHKINRAAITSPMTHNKTQSAAAEFTLKLHNYMCEGLSQDLAQLLQQLHALCDIYDSLANTLQQLSAPRLHEGSSWQEIMRCQKTVEYVFTLFDDLEAGYNDIKAKVQHVSVKEIPGLKRPGNTVDYTHCPSVWLPEHLSSARLDLPTLLRYKHKKQLICYTTQLHKLQLLQLSRHTMIAVEKEMLPVLQQMDVTHPSYLSLYRAVYALLCTKGCRFPVMVQDSPETDTQSEDINDF